MMENSDVLNRLSPDWNELEEIVVYGFGRTAVRNIDKLAEDFHISLIIDNNPKIHGKITQGGVKYRHLKRQRNNCRERKLS